MTTSKLTAKLSDGREAVVTQVDEEGGSAIIVFTKPEPPKEVWIMTGPDGKKDLYTYEHNALFNKGPRDSIARYTLAPEPDKFKYGIRKLLL